MIINEWKRIRIVKFLSLGCIFAVITWEWCGNYTHNAHRRWFKSADSYHDHCVVHELYDTWKELLIVGVSCIYENIILTPAERANGDIVSPKKLDLNRTRILRKEFFKEKYQKEISKFLTDYLLEGKIIYIYRFFKYEWIENKHQCSIIFYNHIYWNSERLFPFILFPFILSPNTSKIEKIII